MKASFWLWLLLLTMLRSPFFPTSSPSLTRTICWKVRVDWLSRTESEMDLLALLFQTFSPRKFINRKITILPKVIRIQRFSTIRLTCFIMFFCVSCKGLHEQQVATIAGEIPRFFFFKSSEWPDEKLCTRASHVPVDLGWVDLDLGVPPGGGPLL